MNKKKKFFLIIIFIVSILSLSACNDLKMKITTAGKMATINITGKPNQFIVILLGNNAASTGDRAYYRGIPVDLDSHARTIESIKLNGKGKGQARINLSGFEKGQIIRFGIIGASDKDFTNDLESPPSIPVDVP